MQVETREFTAQARFQRVSPQKARLVLELIKGQSVVEKVLRSALQNANYLSQEQGLDVDVDNLYVKSAIANDGPRMKRIRPAPMGRAYRYQRRLSHIVISVAERGSSHRSSLVTTVGEEETAPKAKKAAKKAPAKKAAAKKTVAKKSPAKKKAAK